VIQGTEENLGRKRDEVTGGRRRLHAEEVLGEEG
jgi:hypothetical protein